MSNIVEAMPRAGVVARTKPLWQYDSGQIIRVTGITLPATYKAEFSNSTRGNAVPTVQTTDEITVPAQFLQSGNPVYIWLVVVDENSRTTEYAIMTPVTPRAQPTDETPTPEEQSEIDHAIAALNTGVETVQGIAEAIPETINAALAAAKASGEFDGEDGVSPAVTVTEITGGHQVTITDADHPQGQSFDVLDGQGGGGGTSDYDDLDNKPQIGGVTLSGNKSLSDLGIAPASAIPDVSGKADKVQSATSGNFAALDNNGNLMDSGKKPADFITQETDPTVPEWAKEQNKPTYTASEIGLGNVANERQYSANNPPPADASKQDKITASGILKGDGQGGVAAATPGADYGTYSKPASGIPASDLAAGVIPAVPSASDTSPQPLGTASAGSSEAYSRADHVHAKPTAADVGAVASNQGQANAGKFMVVGNDGTVSPVAMAVWQGGSY